MSIAGLNGLFSPYLMLCYVMLCYEWDESNAKLGMRNLRRICFGFVILFTFNTCTLHNFMFVSIQ